MIGEVARRDRDRPAADHACGVEAGSGRQAQQGGVDGQDPCGRHAAQGGRYGDPAAGCAGAIPRTRCSNGSTAMPAAPGWWMAHRKSTRWCWRGPTPRRATTSGAGARAGSSRRAPERRRGPAFGQCLGGSAAGPVRRRGSGRARTSRVLASPAARAGTSRHQPLNLAEQHVQAEPEGKVKNDADHGGGDGGERAGKPRACG